MALSRRKLPTIRRSPAGWRPMKRRRPKLESLEQRRLMAGVAGDANLDGVFDSEDIIQVFQSGKYETGESATWGEGDWDDDGYFDTGDLLSAFQNGAYRQPEPPEIDVELVDGHLRIYGTDLEDNVLLREIDDRVHLTACSGERTMSIAFLRSDVVDAAFSGDPDTDSFTNETQLPGHGLGSSVAKCHSDVQANNAPVVRPSDPLVLEQTDFESDRSAVPVGVQAEDPDGDDLIVSLTVESSDDPPPAMAGLSDDVLVVQPITGRSGRLDLLVSVSDKHVTVTQTVPVTILPEVEHAESTPKTIPVMTEDGLSLTSHWAPIMTEDGFLVDYYVPGDPIAFIVDGYGGCCAHEMNVVIDHLRAEGVRIHYSDWNDVLALDGNRYEPIHNLRSGTSEATPGGIAVPFHDETFVRDMQYLLTSEITADTPVILIGHSFGADSLIEVVRGIPSREIMFLGTLDAIAAGGVRSTQEIPSNVRHLFNRWQEVSIWPISPATSGEFVSHAVVSNQAEQSVDKNADGSIQDYVQCSVGDYVNPLMERQGFCNSQAEENGERIGSIFDGFTCVATLFSKCDSKAGSTIGGTIGGAMSNAERPRLLTHEEVPSDAFVQRQMIDAINQSLLSTKTPQQAQSILWSYDWEKFASTVNLMSPRAAAQILWEYDWNRFSDAFNHLDVGTSAEILWAYDWDRFANAFNHLDVDTSAEILWQYDWDRFANAFNHLDLETSAEILWQYDWSRFSGAFNHLDVGTSAEILWAYDWDRFASAFNHLDVDTSAEILWQYDWDRFASAFNHLDVGVSAEILWAYDWDRFASAFNHLDVGTSAEILWQYDWDRFNRAFHHIDVHQSAEILWQYDWDRLTSSYEHISLPKAAEIIWTYDWRRFWAVLDHLSADRGEAVRDVLGV